MATIILIRGLRESKEDFQKRIQEKEMNMIIQSVEHRGNKVELNYFESLNK